MSAYVFFRSWAVNERNEPTIFFLFSQNCWYRLSFIRINRSSIYNTEQTDGNVLCADKRFLSFLRIFKYINILLLFSFRWVALVFYHFDVAINLMPTTRRGFDASQIAFEEFRRKISLFILNVVMDFTIEEWKEFAWEAVRTGSLSYRNIIRHWRIRWVLWMRGWMESKVWDINLQIDRNL